MIRRTYLAGGTATGSAGREGLSPARSSHATPRRVGRLNFFEELRQVVPE